MNEKLKKKLGTFLRARNYTHKIETIKEEDPANISQRVNSADRLYGYNLNTTPAKEEKEVVDEMSSADIELALKLGASDDRDDIKKCLEDIQNCNHQLKKLSEQQERHLNTIKLIMITYAALTAISVLMTLIQYFKLASLF